MDRIMRVDIVENEDEVIAHLCRIIEEKAKRAIAERSIFIVGLSGDICINQTFPVDWTIVIPTYQFRWFYLQLSL